MCAGDGWMDGDVLLRDCKITRIGKYIGSLERQMRCLGVVVGVKMLYILVFWGTPGRCVEIK